ncbi:hypothetical protein B0I35DRAFT_475988 [Stachybotrys elegans]|uniref:Uncharacterized protein n=1 Tax=Stachybotrys elegans TaxID=80388 RepID=A0A8K0WVS7_9HYPO|nr:hypothetical protein B0I35DRAFT_475988 [Stachybotrys elegans]
MAHRRDNNPVYLNQAVTTRNELDSPLAHLNGHYAPPGRAALRHKNGFYGPNDPADDDFQPFGMSTVFDLIRRNLETFQMQAGLLALSCLLAGMFDGSNVVEFLDAYEFAGHSVPEAQKLALLPISCHYSIRRTVKDLIRGQSWEEARDKLIDQFHDANTAAIASKRLREMATEHPTGSKDIREWLIRHRQYVERLAEPPVRDSRYTEQLVNGVPTAITSAAAVRQTWREQHVPSLEYYKVHRAMMEVVNIEISTESMMDQRLMNGH